MVKWLNNKLLIISGPTATGKTALAVNVAQKYPAELVSADSRQIYQGLDIGVGKDHPVGTPIHLIDILTPDKIYSSSQFRDAALKVISKLQQDNRLPILVGCSGFYIDAIVNSQPTFKVKPNRILRFFLYLLPLNLLQSLLHLIDRQTYLSLNNSDIHNPRRLVRKIEIKLSPTNILSSSQPNFDILHLSLTAPNEVLYSRIDARVDERLKIGHLDELKTLLKKYNWNAPGLKVSAYQVFKDYFVGHSTLAAATQKWKYFEHRDARHQKTWYKKLPHTLYFDITSKDYPKIALTTIDKWYNKS